VLAFWLALGWERRRAPGYFFALAIVLALGAYSHHIFYLLLLAFVVFVLSGARRSDLPYLVGATAVYVVLVIPFFALGAPDEPSAEASSAAAGYARRLLSDLVMPRDLAFGLGVSVALFIYQFFFALALAALGFGRLWRGQRRLA